MSVDNKLFDQPIAKGGQTNLTKIAYLRFKDDLPLNKVMPGVLSEVFPEAEVEVIDLFPLVSKRWVPIIVNFWYVFLEFGVFTDRKRLRRVFWKTTYMFDILKAIVDKAVADRGFSFTFQIQSLFDGQVSGLPHFIYTDHTHLVNLTYPGYDRSNLLPQSWINLETEIYRNADLTFTMSQHVSASLVEQYHIPAEKVACVYGGTNFAIDQVEVEADRPFNKNILFVGIDWPRKGGEALVKAFQQVLQSHPDATLTLVGASPNLDAELTKNIRVAGKVDLNTMRKYYADASIFCLPTRLEPFGIAFIEAMSYRLPIVATRIGAIPDFVTDGKNGFLVDVDDVDSLADRLIQLLDNPAMAREFGKAGYQNAVSRYNWQSSGQLIRKHILANFVSPS